MNLKHIARLHVGLTNVAEFLDLAIGANDEVLADLPRLAAGHAKRAILAAVGQNARCHGLQKPNPSHAAVSAHPAPGAA